MHNLYPLLYNGTVFELTQEYFGQGLVWGRSGYAGSQRYPIQWGGDSYASFDQMACQLRGLLSYGMSGVPYCSHDVGGFDYPPRAFDEADLDAYPLDAAVYIRWLQFGVFSSHLRAHGKQPREPWEYGEAAEAIAHKYLKLRYRLLPYIYTEAVASSVTGFPMVKPLVLDYQDDPNTEQIDLQFLFGAAFLVAPVFTEDQPRQVYLPQGDWVDYWTKEVVSGGRWVQVAVPLETLPLWVKAGMIVPMGPDMDYVDQKPLDPLTLEIYAPGEKGELIVREEGGLDIPVRMVCQDGTLKVQFGPTPGRVEIVLFGVRAHQAQFLEKELELMACPGGQVVAMDGRDGGQVVFYLS
jgi:alpha-D-xyloside xylohydrolase